MEKEGLEKIVSELEAVLTKLKAHCYDKPGEEKPAGSIKELRNQVSKRNQHAEEEK